MRVRRPTQDLASLRRKRVMRLLVSENLAAYHKLVAHLCGGGVSRQLATQRAWTALRASRQERYGELCLLLHDDPLLPRYSPPRG